MLIVRNLWLHMKAVLRSARQIINRQLKTLGLSSAEGNILFLMLTGSNDVQQEQIAVQLDIGKAAVSRAVDSLVSKGYVVRTRQEQDKRAYSISLTDKAYQAGESITDIYNRTYALIKKSIPEGELERMESMLFRASENLQALETDDDD